MTVRQNVANQEKHQEKLGARKAPAVLRSIARLSSPTLSAILSRMSQFLILFSLTAISDANDRSSAVVAFGLISAVGIMADTGAANYLLTRTLDEATQKTFIRVVGVQAVSSLVGAVGCIAYASAVVHLSHTTISVIVALSCVQVFEAVGKAARAPYLVLHQPVRYVVPEVLIAIVKAFCAGYVLLVGASALPYWLLAVFSAMVIGIVAIRTKKLLVSTGPERSRVTELRDVLRFGLSGATSAVYSQVPLLIAPLVMPVGEAAIVAFVLRIIQPPEVVPATISAQLLPRLRDATSRTTILTWWGFLAIGLVTAVSIGSVSGWVTEIFFDSPVSLFVLIAFLMSMVIKSGNYGLVAVVLALRRPNARSICNIGIGAIAVLGAWYGGTSAGARGIGVSMLLCEALLSACLLLIVLVPRRVHK
ncbi:hypothetical protein GYA93_19140 [Gordonia desulfuricans]|uniref:Oligosaccharide flippase family protein n=1 Tax=Gordonia desulfuricans TaxID=89051 RepID=A0A7K3LTW9_9ACTN|nr:hypothetical protein [Gordonia desulfuricans]NDK91672.1 hypothetical protein [Gordonia desulfuricans]